MRLPCLLLLLILGLLLAGPTEAAVLRGRLQQRRERLQLLDGL